MVKKAVISMNGIKIAINRFLKGTIHTELRSLEDRACTRRSPVVRSEGKSAPWDTEPIYCVGEGTYGITSQASVVTRIGVRSRRGVVHGRSAKLGGAA